MTNRNQLICNAGQGVRKYNETVDGIGAKVHLPINQEKPHNQSRTDTLPIGNPARLPLPNQPPLPNAPRPHPPPQPPINPQLAPRPPILRTTPQPPQQHPLRHPLRNQHRPRPQLALRAHQARPDPLRPRPRAPHDEQRARLPESQIRRPLDQRHASG